MSSPQDRGGVVESSSSDSPTLSDGGNGGAPPLPRKPIPRKGHTKSRRGCFNCKKRYFWRRSSAGVCMCVYIRSDTSTEGSNATKGTLNAAIVSRRDCSASIQQTSFKRCSDLDHRHRLKK
ncbi:hypothetical protein IG631_19196 [Alternaria alternata]|nr:hypothetical protein IG631_19196 [Alternaria alternata]